MENCTVCSYGTYACPRSACLAAEGRRVRGERKKRDTRFRLPGDTGCRGPSSVLRSCTEGLSRKVSRYIRAPKPSTDPRPSTSLTNKCLQILTRREKRGNWGTSNDVLDDNPCSLFKSRPVSSDKRKWDQRTLGLQREHAEATNENQFSFVVLGLVYRDR